MIHLGTERYIDDILEEHLEMLQLLWEQRSAALGSGYDTIIRIRQFDERIAAHEDGLVLAGTHAFELLTKGMLEGEETLAYAAARCLLLTDHEEAAGRVIDALSAVDPPQLDGICRALGEFDALRYVKRLMAIVESENKRAAFAAAEVMTRHGQAPWHVEKMGSATADDDAWVRRSAWRMILLSTDTGRTAAIPPSDHWPRSPVA